MAIVAAVIAASSIAAAFAPAALAQSERPGAAPSPIQPPAENTCPPGSSTPSSNETTGSALSDRLSQSKGVICPPAGVDPRHYGTTDRRRADAGDPAPWDSGGDPNIQPKSRGSLN
jgi:hypothetical protein